ncbi:MAG: hypothetical protein FWE69_00545 [Clostridiales bacterium]|nr:hypothetical protein [Clostridiales bacterium]
MTIMKLWAKTLKNHKIISEVVREVILARPSDFDDLLPVLRELARELDLACPVLLQNHISDFNKFGRVIFRKSDFMEEISFDRFEIELIIEKKKTNHVEVFYT